MAVPVQKTVRVSFPCVHGTASGQLVTISSFLAEELKGPIKVISGIDEQAAQRIIGSVRYNEADCRAGAGVIASFSSPFFTGDSYALALAIADKMTRLDTCGTWSAIYATGSIPSDGCGVVKGIRAFMEKIELLMKQGQEGSLFVFPADNLSGSSDAIMDKLNQLKAKGIKCIAVRDINDLEGVIWLSAPAEKKYSINCIERGRQYLLKLKKRISPKLFRPEYIAAMLLLVMIYVIALKYTPPDPENGGKQEGSARLTLHEDVANEPGKNSTNDQKNTPVKKQEKEMSAIDSGDIDISHY